MKACFHPSNFLLRCRSIGKCVGSSGSGLLVNLLPNSTTLMRRHVPPSLSGTAGNVLHVMMDENCGRNSNGSPYRGLACTMSPPEISFKIDTFRRSASEGSCITAMRRPLSRATSGDAALLAPRFWVSRAVGRLTE